MNETFSPPDWAVRTKSLAGPGWFGVPIDGADAEELQRFLEANPDYSRLVAGRDWLPGEALSELTERPPADWPQGPLRHLAVLDAESGAWRGYLNWVEDLLAPGVWHIGLFLIDARSHGSGLATQVFDAWAAHAQAQGARWLRLGAVVGNARAEAFWRRQGYRDVRLRDGIPMGLLSQQVRVMVRPLGSADLASYLQAVPRDRPEAP
ncbi:MAG: GNAT family N-acetyltransferase [Inhella sp.]